MALAYRTFVQIRRLVEHRTDVFFSDQARAFSPEDIPDTTAK